MKCQATVLALLVWALGFLTMAQEPAKPVAEVSIKESTDSFESGGVKIPIEIFAPAGEGKHAGLLLVHGADGMALAPLYRAAARKIAERGYVVVLPHYFDRTQTKTGDHATNIKNFPTWLATLSDATTYLAGMKNVDDQELGLVGFSLGAFLSLSDAAGDPRIKAVVEYFGGFPGARLRDLKKMPPVLILHGEQDKTVPVEMAHALENVLKEKGVEYEIKLYPEQGHGFRGEDSLDAMKRTLNFLDKHLSEAKEKAK